jgi:hypothetical protein
MDIRGGPMGIVFSSDGIVSSADGLISSSDDFVSSPDPFVISNILSLKNAWANVSHGSIRYLHGSDDIYKSFIMKK